MASADTIRILVATDSHVGYNERDPIRGDDSWKSFDEVMTLARERDVDMVLLSGDLFHENKPSRKALYQTMKTLRSNCYGEKPCELEIMSDTSQEFQTGGGCINYQDPDINVAIPVFSIHGNHDDPSGEGRMCALDILAVSGMLNYFGRAPESDNITITPVLLQKGFTKLALYGLSNVRDERLNRTFRDGKVRFMRPEVQQKEWFNLMCVHQNHHAHTETSYIPEKYLSDFLDLVIWGHEHECVINPRKNPEMGFDVIQPGSSVATSLCEGESVTKHVCILSIHGRSYTSEPIRLKTVRPFVMREVQLANEAALKSVWKKSSNRTAVTQFLSNLVEDLIKEATTEWIEAQEDESVPEADCPLPLVRLRIEYSAPEGGKFEIENPQRFSNRFIGKVANTSDVVQFYRKKSALRRTRGSTRTTGGDDEEVLPGDLLAAYGGSIDNIRVEKLVQEFLDKATLSILPEKGLGDAIGQFVDKDDRHAVEAFVDETLKGLGARFDSFEELNEELVAEIVAEHKSYLEDLFDRGLVKPVRPQRRLKEKPDNWDSDIDGTWADQPAAHIRDEELLTENDDATIASDTPAARGGRGRGRGSRGGRGRGAASTTTRKTAATKKAPAKAPAKASARGRRKAAVSESEEEEISDEDMGDASEIDVPDAPDEDDEDDENDEDDDDEEPVAPKRTTARTRAGPATASKAKAATAPKAKAKAAPKAVAKPAPKKAAAATAASTRQTRLNFRNTAPNTRQSTQTLGSQASNALFHRNIVHIPSDDEDIDDEDEYFVPLPAASRGRKR